MIADNENIVRVSGFGDSELLAQRLASQHLDYELIAVKDHPYQQYVHDYYTGDKNALGKIIHEQSGSAFQEKVWKAMVTIAYGDTASYKQLAEQIGSPAAVRAVGTTCGRNHLILLVPCHRVLKSDGSVGSYLYGPAIKESLLRHEGALS